MPSENNTIRIEIRSGSLEVNQKTLDKIKQALQHFVEAPGFPRQFSEHRAQMRDELTASASWVENGEAGVGTWRLTVENGGLVLVRYPPPVRGTMYIYRAAVEQDGSNWKVLSLTQERELGPE